MAAKGLTGILAALLAARASVAADFLQCCPCKERGLCEINNQGYPKPECQRAPRWGRNDTCGLGMAVSVGQGVDAVTGYICDKDVVLEVHEEHLHINCKVRENCCDLKSLAEGWPMAIAENSQLVKEKMAAGLTPTISSQDGRTWVYDGVYKKLKEALPDPKKPLTDILTELLLPPVAPSVEEAMKTLETQLETAKKELTTVKAELKKTNEEYEQEKAQLATQQEKELNELKNAQKEEWSEMRRPHEEQEKAQKAELDGLESVLPTTLTRLEREVKESPQGEMKRKMGRKHRLHKALLEKLMKEKLDKLRKAQEEKWGEMKAKHRETRLKMEREHEAQQAAQEKERLKKEEKRGEMERTYEGLTKELTKCEAAGKLYLIASNIQEIGKKVGEPRKALHHLVEALGEEAKKVTEANQEALNQVGRWLREDATPFLKTNVVNILKDAKLEQGAKFKLEQDLKYYAKFLDRIGEELEANLSKESNALKTTACELKTIAGNLDDKEERDEMEREREAQQAAQEAERLKKETRLKMKNALTNKMKQQKVLKEQQKAQEEETIRKMKNALTNKMEQQKVLEKQQKAQEEETRLEMERKHKEQKETRLKMEEEMEQQKMREEQQKAQEESAKMERNRKYEETKLEMEREREQTMLDEKRKYEEQEKERPKKEALNEAARKLKPIARKIETMGELFVTFPKKKGEEANQKEAGDKLMLIASNIKKIGEEAVKTLEEEEGHVNQIADDIKDLSKAVKELQIAKTLEAVKELQSYAETCKNIADDIKEFNKKARRRTRRTTRARSHKLFRRLFKSILTKWMS